MTIIKVTLVESEDWSGLYFNGVLKTQGHAISYGDFEDAWENGDSLVFTSTVHADEEWLDDLGRLPEKLSDVIIA